MNKQKSYKSLTYLLILSINASVGVFVFGYEAGVISTLTSLLPE